MSSLFLQKRPDLYSAKDLVFSVKVGRFHFAYEVFAEKEYITVVPIRFKIIGQSHLIEYGKGRSLFSETLACEPSLLQQSYPICELPNLKDCEVDYSNIHFTLKSQIKFMGYNPLDCEKVLKEMSQHEVYLEHLFPCPTKDLGQSMTALSYQNQKVWSLHTYPEEQLCVLSQSELDFSL